MSTPLRVAVVNLTGGGLSGGYRKYLGEVLPRLAAHREIGELHVFSPAAIGRVAVAGQPYSWSSSDAWLGLPGVRRQLDARRIDVVFVPTARWLRVPMPVVTMVRNMEPFETGFTNPLPEAFRNRLRRLEAWRACRRSTRTIAVSEHVRDHLVRRWGLSEDRIGVVKHGVAAPLAADRMVRPAALAGDMPFVFTAGSIRPARGLEDLIEAAPRIAASEPLRIVIAGGVDRFMTTYARRLQARARALGVGEKTVWTGGLSANEMAWCFGHAAAFVMTSRAEACPNTALEAMSHGTASVAVAREPFREFFGNAAVYYQQGRPDTLSTAIAGAIVRRRELGDAARHRAAMFDWDRAVEETVEQLRIAVRAHGAGEGGR